MKDFFPQEVWEHIFSYDPTYRTMLLDVQQELRDVLSTLYTVMYATDPAQIMRKETKEDLLKVVNFLHIRLTSPHNTKKKLAFLLYAYVNGVAPLTESLTTEEA